MVDEMTISDGNPISLTNQRGRGRPRTWGDNDRVGAPKISCRLIPDALRWLMGIGGARWLRGIIEGMARGDVRVQSRGSDGSWRTLQPGERIASQHEG